MLKDLPVETIDYRLSKKSRFACLWIAIREMAKKLQEIEIILLKLKLLSMSDMYTRVVIVKKVE